MALLLCAVALLLPLIAASSAQAFIYWANIGGGIGRANNDGTGAVQTFIGGQTAPSNVAVNSTHIFWANSNSGTSIGRAKLDGTQVQKNFIPAASPYGVAVTGQYIYWTNNNAVGADSIGRANLDGSGVNPNFIPLPNALYNGVAVDATHIFWADGFQIGRANINGTGIDTNFMNTPGGMVIARPLVNDRYLYATGVVPNGDGTYGPAGHVLRGPIAGDALASIIPVSSPGGVAVYGNALYFGRYGSNAKLPNDIGRAGLDGSSPQFGLVPQALFPNGIAVNAGGTVVIAGLKCKHQKCLLVMHVPIAGVVKLAGKGIKPKKRTVEAPGDIKLRVVARGGVRRKLAESDKARIKVKAILTAPGLEPAVATAKRTMRG